MMSSFKYLSLDRPGTPPDMHITPPDAIRPIVCLDGSSVENAIFFQASWLMTSFEQTGMVRHTSDALLIFIGSNPDDHENLNAHIELWIENDKLTLTETSIVFVPRGTAYGRMKATNVTKPVIFYRCLMNVSFYEEEPAAPSAPAGTYAHHAVQKYAPVDGFLPPAPEGFLTRLLWLDSAKLRGAPYMEAVWFHTKNDTGPENHFHDFDEIIGFLGSDPENPQELHGEISMLLDGETVRFTKSCVAYIPRGVTHSPILVPRLDQSIIHFSGGNGGDYARRDQDGDTDIFRTSPQQAQ